MDIAAEIRAQQSRLAGGWGEIRVPDAGYWTRPVDLEYGQNLILPPGHIWPVNYNGTTFTNYCALINPKGYNKIIGSGHNTVIQQPPIFNTDGLGSFAGGVVISPYWNNQGRTGLAGQPAYFGLEYRNFQIRGTRGNLQTGAAGLAVTLANAIGGLMKGIYFNGLHGLNGCIGGPTGVGQGGYASGMNQRVLDCVFEGGNDGDHVLGQAMLSIVNAVNVLISRCIFRRIPYGGCAIDIEPNAPGDRAQNIMITDNIMDFRRNAGTGTAEPGYHTSPFGNVVPDVIDGGEQGYYNELLDGSPLGLICNAGEPLVRVGPAMVANNMFIGGWAYPGDTKQRFVSAHAVEMRGYFAHAFKYLGNMFVNVANAGMVLNGQHIDANENTFMNVGEAIIHSGRHTVIARNRIGSYATGANFQPRIRESVAGPDGFTGYNTIADNYLGWVQRNSGSPPIAPSVPPPVATSDRGAKSSANRALPEDVQECKHPDDIDP